MKTGQRIGDLEIALQNLSVIQKVNVAENSLIKTVTILKSFGKLLSRSCLARKQSVLPVLILMELKFTMTRKLQTALIISSLKLWTDSFKFLDDVYHLMSGPSYTFRFEDVSVDFICDQLKKLKKKKLDLISYLHVC